VSAGLCQGLNQKCADFLCQIGHLRRVKPLKIGRRVDGLQQYSHLQPFSAKSHAIGKKPFRTIASASFANQEYTNGALLALSD
jgi:hypothetical protein